MSNDVMATLPPIPASNQMGYSGAFWTECIGKRFGSPASQMFISWWLQ